MTVARRPATTRSPARLFALVVLIALLAACGSQPTTTGAPSSAPPTADGAASPSVAPTRTPTPSADPGQAAVAKFVALAINPSFAYQATFTGESRHTVDVVPITKGLLQVSGKDVLVRATFTLRGQRVVVEHRSVGGRGWIKYGSDAWQRLTGFGAAQSMAAFAAVHGAADVIYLGPAPGGKGDFLASIQSAVVNPVMIPASNLTDVAVTTSKFTLIIDGAGRPVSATGTIEGHGRVSGQLQEVAIDLTLTFTKVGQKVAITVP